MLSPHELFTNAPRPIVFIDQQGMVRAHNNAFRSLLNTLSMCGHTPVASALLIGSPANDLFENIDRPPIADKVGVATSKFKATFHGLDSTLGMRQVDLGDNHVGAALYWTRFTGATLSNTAVQASIIINNIVNNPDTATLCSDLQLAHSFDRFVVALLDVEQATRHAEYFREIRDTLTAQLRALCLHSHRKLSHGVTVSPNAVSNAEKASETLDHTLRLMLASYGAVREGLAPFHSAYCGVTKYALQSQLLATLLWFESTRHEGRSVTASMSENVAAFAQRGLSTAQHWQSVSSISADDRERGTDAIRRAIVELANINTLLANELAATQRAASSWAAECH